MIRRELQSELVEAAGEYPVVSVFGPRQSGKTTLVCSTFPQLPYYSMENPDVRAAARTDPRGFLRTLNRRAILDEIQRTPELLSYLQEMVDSNKRDTRFVLTGSHQPFLNQSISQSLPGRTSVSTLMPFTRAELTGYPATGTVFDAITKGSFPAVHEESLDVRRFFRSYVQTCVERDVRALVAVHDLDRFQQFLILLAGRVGQLVNLSALSSDVGVASATLRSWLNVLKASYLIVELPPWHANIRKRLVRSSKLYFTDTGLACFLLGIENGEQLKRDRQRGGLFENFIVMDIWKSLLHAGETPTLYFFRDSHGNEVDLLIRRGGRLIPVEIKSAETFSTGFVDGIRRFARLVDEPDMAGHVVYAGETSFTVDRVKASPVNQFQVKELL